MRIGISPSLFFEYTPYEINLRFEGEAQNIENSYIKLHTLGTLVAIGVNSPKDYPSIDKFIKRPKKKSDLDKKLIKDELMSRYIRRRKNKCQENR